MPIKQVKRASTALSGSNYQMNISHFPNEILTNILCPWDSSSLCIPLWKTGNRLLQHQLTNAMISLDLRSSRLKFQVPSVISKLPRLRHFSLLSPAADVNVCFVNHLQLETLPPTLETLELDFIASPKLYYYGLDPEDSYGIPVKTRYSRGSSHYIDLNALFPHLTSLTLGDDFLSPPIDPKDLFPALPSALTELSSGKVEITSSFASMLPRSLIKLNCWLDLTLLPPSSKHFDTAWFDAPPRLEYIHTLELVALPSSPSWLPSSITRIDWCHLMLSSSQDMHLPAFMLLIKNMQTHPPAPTLNWTSKLPPTVEILNITSGASLPLSYLHCLPLSLTDLHAAITWSNQDLEDAKERNLATLWPPALTRLEVDTRDFDEFMAILPPSLNTLSLPRALYMPGQVIERRWDLRALPPLLRSLTTRIDPQCFDSWPLNLEFLEVHSLNSKSHTQWPTLPSSLTELAWFNFNSKAFASCQDSPLLLPSKLASLRLSTWRTLWFHHLPRTVTDLGIHSLEHPSDATKGPDPFLELPDSLTQLWLTSAEWIHLSDISLAHLHRLTSLYSKRVSITSPAICNLPRNMTSLHVSIWPLDSRYLRFLPRTLRTCRLSIDWSAPGISNYWPPTLASFVEEPSVREAVKKRYHRSVSEGLAFDLYHQCM